MSDRRRARMRGFTLIELLIVVAIIGLIAAILIPNFLDAIQKGRQKRTMGSLRDFGLGMAQYWTEFSGAAAAGAAGTTLDISEWTGTSDIAEIRSHLVPDYLPQMPEQDAWGTEIEYRVHINNPPRTRFALARSGGSNRDFDGDEYEPGVFSGTDFEQDLVWADGTFIRAPETAQQGT